MQTITQKVLEETVYSGAAPVLTYTIRYPFFATTCSSAAAASINAYYEASARKMEEYCRTVLFSQASVQAEYAKKDKIPFFEYEFISAYTITWNSGCFTSLYTDQYTYTGGAHGSTLRTSDTWDFNSGRYIPLAEFYPHNRAYLKSIKDNLESQIKDREKEAPASYFDDYASLLQTSFRPENYYVTPQGITIYFQQYDIAPYSTGIPEFLLPFQNKAEG